LVPRKYCAGVRASFSSAYALGNVDASNTVARGLKRAEDNAGGFMMLYRAALGMCALVLSSFAFNPAALAGGYEFPGEGTRALGRGGAFAARADDPMAVAINPAGLAAMPGIQLLGSVGLLFAKNCFHRDRPGESAQGAPTAPAWDRGWGSDAAGNRIPYTEVCNQQGKRITPIPTLGFSLRFEKPKINVGIGALVSAANSERAQRWGERSYSPSGQPPTYLGYLDASPGSRGTPGGDALVPLDNGQRLLPAPSRFMVVDRRMDLYYLTAAIGMSPSKVKGKLQFGVGGGCGFAGADLTYNMRYRTNGEEPSELEGQSTFSGRDGCAPRVVGSIHGIVADRLDIVGAVRWDGPIKAKGQVSTIQEGEPTKPFDGQGTLTMPRPIWVTAGFRYGQRVDGLPRSVTPDADGRRSGRVEDAMANERWDLELNVVYERNRDISDFTIDGVEGFGGIKLEHNWQDQLSVRVGGDWNAIANALALRAGFSYETSGFTSIRVKNRLISNGGTLDFMPGQRFGLHLGLTARFNSPCSLGVRQTCRRQPNLYQRRAELSMGFAYFWMTAHNNANGDSTQVVLSDDAPGDSNQIAGDVVNNGAFSSRYVVASLGFRYLFKGLK